MGDAHVKNATYGLLPKQTLLGLVNGNNGGSGNGGSGGDEEEDGGYEEQGQLRGWDDDDVFSISRGIIRGSFTTPALLPPLQPLPSKVLLRALAGRAAGLRVAAERREREEEERERRQREALEQVGGWVGLVA
jgi:hypothetical protein